MQNNRVNAMRQQSDFAKTDTIRFFVSSPQALRDLQNREWLPVIEWINARGCDFTVYSGFEVQSLSDKTKDFLENRLSSLSDEAFYAFCAVSGGCRSVILALAVLDGFLTPQRAFELSMLEEDYQNKIWKQDEDALVSREGRRQSVLEAAEKLKGM